MAEANARQAKIKQPLFPSPLREKIRRSWGVGAWMRPSKPAAFPTPHSLPCCKGTNRAHAQLTPCLTDPSDLAPVALIGSMWTCWLPYHASPRLPR